MSDPNSPKAAGWAGATPSLSPKLRLVCVPVGALPPHQTPTTTFAALLSLHH
jgi:hypothetical protein